MISISVSEEHITSAAEDAVTFASYALGNIQSTSACTPVIISPGPSAI